MGSFIYLSRIGLLVFIFLLLFAISFLNRWDDIADIWYGTKFKYQIVITILIVWPIAGYLTPILIGFWSFIAEMVIGLGGEYLITDINTILLLILIAGIATQTTMLVVKLNQLEEEL